MCRNPILRVATALLAAWIAAACAPAAAPDPAAPFAAPLSNRTEPHEHDEANVQAHSHLAESDVTETLEVVIVPSELTVGPNRFAVGLFDSEGAAVEDATVHFHYFDLTDAQAPALESEADATRLQTPDGTTIFAHEREFSHAGLWGVEVQAHFADGRSALKRVRFEVVADSPTLKVGARVPAVDTPTAASANGDLTRITSAPQPNPAFYATSLAEALDAGAPTALLFATPAFCMTRFCGPSYEIASELQKQYGDRVTFLHVEIYTGLPNPAANNWEIAPAMAAFGLSTEPWLYLIDADGEVAYRVEGLFTADEIAPHLMALLE